MQVIGTMCIVALTISIVQSKTFDVVGRAQTKFYNDSIEIGASAAGAGSHGQDVQ